MPTTTKTAKITLTGQHGTSPGAGYFPTKLDVTFSKSRTGVSSPHWKALIEGGSNATTLMSGWVQEQDILLGSAKVVYKYRSSPTGAFVTYTSDIAGYLDYQAPLPLSPHTGAGLTAEANSEALKKLYRTIRRSRSQFAGGVVLGEIRKTVSMFARPVRALNASLRGYVKGARVIAAKNVKTTGAGARALADTYLEATFGWGPLLNDIADGAKALERLYAKSEREHFKVSAVMTGTPVLTSNYWNISNIFIRRERRVLRTDQVIYYGAFKESAVRAIVEDRTQRIRDLSGFAWKDFVPTLWELLPWSFLVDYFTNIGDVLEAVCTDTSSVAWLSKTVRSETEQRSTFVLDVARTKAIFALPYSEMVSFTSTPGVTVARYRSISRAPEAGVPVMFVEFAHPAAWSKQMLNIAALVVSGSRDRYR